MYHLLLHYLWDSRTVCLNPTCYGKLSYSIFSSHRHSFIWSDPFSTIPSWARLSWLLSLIDRQVTYRERENPAIFLCVISIKSFLVLSSITVSLIDITIPYYSFAWRLFLHSKDISLAFSDVITYFPYFICFIICTMSSANVRPVTYAFSNLLWHILQQWLWLRFKAVSDDFKDLYIKNFKFLYFIF